MRESERIGRFGWLPAATAAAAAAAFLLWFPLAYRFSIRPYDSDDDYYDKEKEKKTRCTHSLLTFSTL